MKPAPRLKYLHISKFSKKIFTLFLPPAPSIPVSATVKTAAVRA